MNALVYLVNIVVAVAIAGPIGVIFGCMGAWIGLKICKAIINDN